MTRAMKNVVMNITIMHASPVSNERTTIKQSDPGEEKIDDIKFTVGISNQSCVSIAYSYCKSKDHQDPVDLRDKDLSIYMFRSMDYFDAWEAPKGMALFDY